MNEDQLQLMYGNQPQVQGYYTDNNGVQQVYVRSPEQVQQDMNYWNMTHKTSDVSAGALPNNTNTNTSVGSTNNSLSNGMTQAYKPYTQTVDDYKLNYLGMSYDEALNKAKELGIDPKQLMKGPNGQAILKNERSFTDKYGQDIGLGLGVAQLGLGIGSFLENRATMKKQRALLSEQLRESKSEFDRVNKLRSKLSAEYKGQ